MSRLKRVQLDRHWRAMSFTGILWYSGVKKDIGNPPSGKLCQRLEARLDRRDRAFVGRPATSLSAVGFVLLLKFEQLFFVGEPDRKLKIILLVKAAVAWASLLLEFSPKTKQITARTALGRRSRGFASIASATSSGDT